MGMPGAVREPPLRTSRNAGVTSFPKHRNQDHFLPMLPLTVGSLGR